MAKEKNIVDSEEWIEIGDSSVKEGKFDEAIHCYTKAIGINPRAAFAYFKRGSVLMTLENLREAMNDFNNAITLNPDFSFAYFKFFKYILKKGCNKSKSPVNSNG